MEYLSCPYHGEYRAEQLCSGCFGQRPAEERSQPAAGAPEPVSWNAHRGNRED